MGLTQDGLYYNANSSFTHVTRVKAFRDPSIATGTSCVSAAVVVIYVLLQCVLRDAGRRRR
eukprot:10181035-Alexandrium_andersonii.AAC.1